MTPPVTLVTRDATLDNLSAADYRGIYDELRGRDAATGGYAVSLDKFVTLVTSAYSKAQWSKYHNGDTALTRQMRNELRAAVGLPVLPPTLEEVAGTLNPDALVVRVGDEAPHSVILLATQKSLSIGVNGTIWAKDTTEATEASVTKVTRSQRRRYVRPTATEAQEARRLAVRASWWAVIEAGLTALEG